MQNIAERQEVASIPSHLTVGAQAATPQDEEYALTKVNGNYKNFWQMLVVMVGFTYFSPSMMAGGQLGLGLNFSHFIIAILLGNLFLAVYTGLLAHIGQATRMNFDLLSKKAFGHTGSKLPSLLVGLTQMGWFCVGVAMFAIPVAKLYGLNTYVLVLILGALMTLTSVKGIKALSIFGSIAVPLITLLGFYSMYRSINDVGGVAKLFSDTPAQPITITAALSIVIGNFISGGTSTPNFTRFADNRMTAIISTVIAFFIGNILMFGFGATGAAAFNMPDIFDVLIFQGLTIPAILSLGFNIWSTNNNALYTAGLSISNVTKLPMKWMTLFGGTLATLFAIFLYNNFVSYLSLLGSMIPPVGAVIIIDYFINSKHYQEVETTRQWNWHAIIAVIIGISLGLMIQSGITPINSLIVAGIVYFVLSKVKG